MATPPSVRSLILSQQEEIRVLRQENEQMHQQLTALAAELASLRERIGRANKAPSPASIASYFFACFVLVIEAVRMWVCD